MTLENLISKLPLSIGTIESNNQYTHTLCIDVNDTFEWEVCYYDFENDDCDTITGSHVVCKHKDLSKALYQMIDLINSIDCLKYYG